MIVKQNLTSVIYCYQYSTGELILWKYFLYSKSKVWYINLWGVLYHVIISFYTSCFYLITLNKILYHFRLQIGYDCMFHPYLALLN